MWGCSRSIELVGTNRTVTLRQKTEGEVSTVVWDAALVLAHCLQLNNWCRGSNCLELGSGTGCVGIVAAANGANVVLTDLPETLPLLKQNIADNKSVIAGQGGYATVEALTWGDLESDIFNKMKFDHVFMADCLYYEESIDPLISTLCNINRNSEDKPQIIIAQEMRDSDIQRKVWSVFFDKLKSHFNVRYVPKSEQHPDYNSDDILLMICTRNDIT